MAALSGGSGGGGQIDGGEPSLGDLERDFSIRSSPIPKEGILDQLGSPTNATSAQAAATHEETDPSTVMTDAVAHFTSTVTVHVNGKTIGNFDAEAWERMDVHYQPQYALIEQNISPPAVWHLKQVCKGQMHDMVQARFDLADSEELAEETKIKLQANPADEKTKRQHEIAMGDIKTAQERMHTEGWFTSLSADQEQSLVDAARDMWARRSENYDVPEEVWDKYFEFVTEAAAITQKWHDEEIDAILSADRLAELAHFIDGMQHTMAEARMTWVQQGLAAVWADDLMSVTEYVDPDEENAENTADKSLQTNSSKQTDQHAQEQAEKDAEKRRSAFC